MKKLVTIFVLFFIFSTSKAQNEFITIWKPGTSNLIHFPGRGTNFNVSWEEVGYPQHYGNINSITSVREFIINFGSPFNPNQANATYKIKVSNGNGTFNQIRFFDSSISPIYIGNDREKIVQVTQWGNIAWQNFSNAFVLCTNLNITASDTPNLTNVTDMSYMFYICPSLIGNSSFSNWNTSNITNMNYMFGDCSLFNASISSWNISNVTDLGYMFDGAISFNQPISEWNVSNVTSMEHTFHEATSFNQDLNNWDVSNVTSMNEMFHNAHNFNQNIGSWNLTSLINGVDILLGSGLSCQNYDSTLYGWSLNPNTPQNITLNNVSPLVYSHSAAVNARNLLVNNKGWIISGDTHNPNCLSSLSVSETKNTENVKIYPNPATDFIYIKNIKGNNSYKIFDLNGRYIEKGKIDNEKINIQHLIKGQYILQIESKEKNHNLKFIKK